MPSSRVYVFHAKACTVSYHSLRKKNLPSFSIWGETYTFICLEISRL